MTTPPPPAPGQAIPAVPAPGQAIPAAPTITTGPAEPSTPTTAKPWPFKPAGNNGPQERWPIEHLDTVSDPVITHIRSGRTLLLVEVVPHADGEDAMAGAPRTTRGAVLVTPLITGVSSHGGGGNQ